MIAVDDARLRGRRTGAPSIDDARRRLGPLGDGDAVLVKGSRVAGLERLADRLLGRDRLTLDGRGAAPVPSRGVDSAGVGGLAGRAQVGVPGQRDGDDGAAEQHRGDRTCAR